MEKESRENYLRIILELEKENKQAKSIDISRKLNITKASVSEMIRKLAKNKLISIKPYSKISLTTQGKKAAEEIIEKHSLVKEFMQKALNLEEKQAAEEAHILEHALSENSIDRIREIIEGKEKRKQVIEKELVYVG